MKELMVWVHAAKDLMGKDDGGTSSDPYVTVRFENHQYKTYCIPKDLNPEWNSNKEPEQKFYFPCENSKPEKTLEINVWDRDMVKADFLGRLEFKFADIAQFAGRKFHVLKKRSAKSHISGSLELTIEVGAFDHDASSGGSGAASSGGIKASGDLEIRAYRRKTTDPFLLDNRKAFDGAMGKLLNYVPSTTTLKDFDIKRTLGTGAFGRVLLVQKKQGPYGGSGDAGFYALKIIKKAQVVEQRQVDHLLAEKNILSCIACEYLVNQRDHFQDSKCVYLILDFVSGGEMFTHIVNSKRGSFSFDVTQHFAAQTVLAFEYMHNLDIIFRDLKPENMLISHLGHIKVTDFGFAKRVEDRTYTMCGTPEYLAPEIIHNHGYHHAVDWWAIGVLTYEMRSGRAPFEGASQLDMFRKITRADFKFPRKFTDNEKDFITRLLQIDHTKRLGIHVHNGCQQIKALPYFKNIDWSAMRLAKIKSPYDVSVKGPGDASNFEKFPDEPVDWHTGRDPYAKQFASF